MNQPDNAESMKNNLNAATQQAVQKGREVMHDISDKAHKVASDAGQRTDSVISSIGDGIASVGDSIRKSAPQEGRIGSAATSVAETLESSGQYLKQHGVDAITEDLTGVIRRNPIQSLWIGVGVGVLVGAALSRR